MVSDASERSADTLFIFIFNKFIEQNNGRTNNEETRHPTKIKTARPTKWNKIFRTRELWVRKIGGDNSKSNE